MFAGLCFFDTVNFILML